MMTNAELVFGFVAVAVLVCVAFWMGYCEARRYWRGLCHSAQSDKAALLKELEIAYEEHLSTIDERDMREDQIAAIACELGVTSEWSNMHDLGDEALEAIAALRQRLKGHIKRLWDERDAAILWTDAWKATAADIDTELAQWKQISDTTRADYKNWVTRAHERMKQIEAELAEANARCAALAGSLQDAIDIIEADYGTQDEGETAEWHVTRVTNVAKAVLTDPDATVEQIAKDHRAMEAMRQRKVDAVERERHGDQSRYGAFAYTRENHKQFAASLSADPADAILAAEAAAKPSIEDRIIDGLERFADKLERDAAQKEGK